MTHLLEVEASSPRSPLLPARCGLSTALTSPWTRGEMVGIVGESGSGKTMLVRSIMGLMPPNAKLAPPGRVMFGGEDITDLPRERRNLWGKRIALIPQDPATSLNPVRKVGVQIRTPCVGTATTQEPRHARPQRSCWATWAWRTPNGDCISTLTRCRVACGSES